MNLSGERVLVTGAHGFLGSHLVDVLEARGVRGIVQPTSGDCDLTDVEQVRELFSCEDLHGAVIFHLAAECGGIGANQATPARFLYANALMGLHMLEAARVYKARKIVFVGTVCSYPCDTPVPFREDALWDGHPEETNAPYGIAKRMLVTAAQAYRQQYGLNAICLIPANLYGPRDHFDPETSHVIPALIRKFDEAAREGRNEVVIWGDGSPTREFLYVEDCAEGLVRAAECSDGAEPVNLGTGQEISILDLARQIARMTGYEGRIATDPSRPNGQPRRSLDVSRAKDRFGWEAKVGLEEGLGRTIEWWKAAKS